MKMGGNRRRLAKRVTLLRLCPDQAASTCVVLCWEETETARISRCGLTQVEFAGGVYPPAIMGRALAKETPEQALFGRGERI